jgi:hypothetical protein
MVSIESSVSVDEDDKTAQIASRGARTLASRVASAVPLAHEPAICDEMHETMRCVATRGNTALAALVHRPPRVNLSSASG